MSLSDPKVSALARIALWLSAGGLLLGVSPGTRGLGTLAVVSAALIGALVIVLRRSAWERHWTAAAWAIALVWGVSALAVARGGLREVVIPLALTILLVAFVATPDRARLARDTAWILTLVAAGSLLAGVLSFVVDGSAALDYRWPERQFMGIPRLAGIVGNPNTLAMVAAFGVLVAIINMTPPFWRGGGRFLAPRAILWLLGTSVVTLLWTQSRTSMLALVAAIVALAVATNRRIPGWGIVAVLGAAGALGPLIAWLRWGASFNGRSVAWEVGWQAFLQRPFLGWGPDAYAAGPSFWSGFPGTYWSPRHGHNEIVHVAVQSGIIGCVALAIAAALVLLSVRRLARVSLLACAPVLVYVAWLSGTEMPLGVPGLAGSYVPTLLLTTIVIGTATSHAPEPVSAKGRHRAVVRREAA